VGLALLAAAGCGGGGGSTTSLVVTITPTTAIALTGGFVQFIPAVSGTADSIAFLVNDVEGGNSTVGTISEAGLYQAPAVVPANTTITVKVKVSNSADANSAEAAATVTLDSGVRVSIVPASFTIGTGEQFSFAGKERVTGVPPNAAISGVCGSTGEPLCTAVTWSASTGGGAIDAATGNYTAPASTAAATITATSVYDSTQNATATVTVVTATDPTLTSISDDVGAVGATHQDLYLTGTDFISTTQVRANGNLVADTDVVSGSVLRVRLAASNLTSEGAFTFTVARQGSAEQACSGTRCQLTIEAQRPTVVGTFPDSVSATSTGDIVVDGGYYGPAGNGTVTASFEGQSATVDSPNQLRVANAGTSTPGLAPLTVISSVSSAVPPPRAVANVAVQPSYPTALGTPTSLGVGTQPSSVAINTATGIAVVANRGSNSVALIDLAGPTVLGFICTATQGATLDTTPPPGPSCPVSAPSSVAVDNLRNLALVTNSTAQTVAVISLATQSVQAIIPTGATSIAAEPMGVGINPLSGRAVVAYRTRGFVSLIDLNLSPPAVIGLAAASTGAEPRVAVSPRLNWALVTPGGASGSLAIVDLGRQDTNLISSATRSGNVVTITTASPHTLRSNPSDPVMITGVTPNSFNGVFNVTKVSANTFQYLQNGMPDESGSGGTANYSLPIATVDAGVSVTGVGINDETQKAIVVDPSPFAIDPGRVFNLLDQTFAPIPGLAVPGATAAAFNPFTNVAVTVNKNNSNGSIVDASVPALLGGDGIIPTGVLNQPVDVAIDPGTNTTVIVNQGDNTVSIISLGALRTPQILQVNRQDNGAGVPLPPEITVESTLTTGPSANPQTLRVIGSGFTGSSVVHLDGTALAGLPTVISSRELTVPVPASMLTAGPRLYAVQVVNGASASNAATFTVSQSVDVSSAGCAAPAPQGVAIDYSSRNVAVVTNPSCNNVAIINLGGSNVGQGNTIDLDAGSNPQGVAVHIGSGLAVVANSGRNNAAIIDLSGNTVAATVNTDPTPTGVAIDPGLGLAVVTASNANVINTFTVSSTPGSSSSLAVQQRPVAVAVDPETHVAAVANTSSNTVSLVDLQQGVATEHIAANGLPTGIALDPVNGTFLTTSSLLNQVLILDPVSRTTTQLRVGINPTSIAYNFNSSTLVTTNSSSQTLSVMDFSSRRVRAVLSFRPSGRFAVDIHPFTNLAVIADSAGNRVVLRPLPR
jgi:DNA-binding beta-propeller fold protein YncE